MFSLLESEQQALAALGERLRRRRILSGDTQQAAAARVGISVPTFRKLERGDPSALIGTWIRALRLYGSLSELELVLPGSLFDEGKVRRRVRR